MRYGSLFSGIGGFDLGLERTGMECAWQVEIDANCLKILERHWPNVRRYTDVQEVGKENLEPVDLICGGFPCQDLSVAGRREGITGERSGLWFEFARVIDELEPRWVVIENVPGLLSSKRGQDFATIIRWLVERGYGVAWRILDAQYFGVPQRRRRVFVVGSLGDGRAAEVLFERESSTGDTPPSRKTGKEIAYAITSGLASGYRYSAEDNLIADTLTAGYAKNRGAQAGNASKVSNLITFDANQKLRDVSENIAPTILHSGDGKKAHGAYPKISIIQSKMGARRLTPVECERLQGFPDGWTEGHSDSARYRQLGNAVAVPVAEWIGKRIMEV
jgi:DNA (cytosine-5)-methyltransferase 1